MTSDLCARSPTLRKLLKTRLAPIREKELISKAMNPEKPVKPPAGDCCGSSCKPCIMDLYREELKVWKECWVVEEGKEVVVEVDSEKQKTSIGTQRVEDDDSFADVPSMEKGRRMPGSFDW